MSSSETSPSKVHVELELDRLSKEVHNYSFDDLKNGTWFERFLSYVLATYPSVVSQKYFETEYPDVPQESIVERRIEQAQQYADIEALLTSSAYTWGLIATIGTDGGASPVTVQEGATAFAIDLMFTTQLQIQLAYDLAVLYDVIPDLNNETDKWDLVRVAFGIVESSGLAKAVSKVYPNLLSKLEEENDSLAGKKVVDDSLSQAFCVIGKKLSQRAMIKMGIPAFGIPLSIAVNHMTTRYIGDHAHEFYHDRSTIRKVAGQIAGAGVDPLMMHALWLVAHSEERVSEKEHWLIQEILIDSPELLSEFEGLSTLSKEETFSRIKCLDSNEKILLFDAACKMAAVDHHIARRESKLLKELAPVCGVPFDEGYLEELTQFLKQE